jgi:hypothetical protein
MDISFSHLCRSIGAEVLSKMLVITSIGAKLLFFKFLNIFKFRLNVPLKCLKIRVAALISLRYRVSRGLILFYELFKVFL